MFGRAVTGLERERRWALVALLLVGGCIANVCRAESFSIPPLTGPVVDTADLIPAGTRRTIESALRQVYASGGPQIQVLTVPTLGELTIEDASIRVVDRWALGRKGRDDGVLLFIAKQERKIRIEVGRGLEGELPDAYANRIIYEAIRPLFQSGDYASGIVVGVTQIIQRVSPQTDVNALFGQVRSAPARSPVMPGWLEILIFIFVVFAILSNRSAALGCLLGSLLGGRGWSGGGVWRGGGGFSGGGGWSGGGGGFSGGGASGGW
jgi:uncharacterized protein